LGLGLRPAFCMCRSAKRNEKEKCRAGYPKHTFRHTLLRREFMITFIVEICPHGPVDISLRGLPN
jgi:hypothetical protein